MPQKLQHRKATLGLMGLSWPIMCQYPVEGACILLGEAITMPNKLIYINPDADLVEGKFGRMLGFHLYKRLIRHRSGTRKKDWNIGAIKIFTASHIPIISTLLRFTMVLFVPSIIILAFSSVFQLNIAGILYYLLFIYIGGALSDTLHIFMDVFDTKRKRKSREQIAREFYEYKS
jgi:uncharacterized metal-binding protein